MRSYLNIIYWFYLFYYQTEFIFAPTFPLSNKQDYNMGIFKRNYASNRGESRAFKKLYWISIYIAVLVKFSISYTSLRTSILGSIYNHQYPNFFLIDALPQAQHKSLISSPSFQIIINLIRSLPKTQSCIQIVCLPGGGIFELILATLPNNFNNKIIVVKESPHEYAWVNKNLYLNGLQKETKLYHAVFGNKNYVSYEGMGRRPSSLDILYRNRNCVQCDVQFRIETNLSNLIEIEEGSMEKGDPNLNSTKGKYLELFLQITSKGEAKILNKQLLHLQSRYKIQLVLFLKAPIPLQMIIENLRKEDSKLNKKGYKIYHIILKISNKKSSLQFSQILYHLGTYPQSIDSQSEQKVVLEEGIYYITEDDLLLSSRV